MKWLVKAQNLLLCFYKTAPGKQAKWLLPMPIYWAPFPFPCDLLQCVLCVGGGGHPEVVYITPMKRTYQYLRKNKKQNSSKKKKKMRGGFRCYYGICNLGYRNTLAYTSYSHYRLTVDLPTTKKKWLPSKKVHLLRFWCPL